MSGKKFLCFMVLLCILSLFTKSRPLLAEEEHTVVFLYENYCESCHPEQDFAQQFQALTGLSMESCHFTPYNTITSDGMAVLEKTIEAYHLSVYHLPMAIVDGNIYQESSEFRTKLVLDALDWTDNTDSSLIYLYSPGCESCADVRSLIESFPETFEVTRGDISFSSKLHIIRIDTAQYPEVTRELFDRRGIPDDQRLTPAVLLPNRELIGHDKISRYLLWYIENGNAIGKVELPEQEAFTRRSLIPSLLFYVIAVLLLLLCVVYVINKKRKRIINSKSTYI